jgi:alpha-glucosidase
MSLHRLLLATMVIATACGGGDPEEPLEATIGGLLVRVESEPARLSIAAPGGALLIDGLPGASSNATYPAPQVAGAARQVQASVDSEVGSFKFEEIFVDPWRGAERFTDLRLEDGAVRFSIRGDGGDLGQASIAPGAADGQVRITMTFPETTNRAAMSFACDPDEHFLGFGGQTASADHRGFTVPLWVSEDGITKAPVDSYDWGVWFLQGRLHSTHTPMPMYLSSRGYGLILDTPYRSIFEMCSEDSGAVRIEAWERELRAEVFYGPSPRQVIAKMTAHVGRPEVPPAFTFAPWIDAIYGEDNVRRVAQKLRTEDIPVSVIWSEDWRGANVEGTGYVLEEDWEVDRTLYPNFESLAGELHDNGYKFLIYNNTFLDSRVPAHAEAVAGGHTIKDADGDPYLFTGVKFEPSTLLDLSSPAAVEWGKGKYRAGLELGADGYMADFAEWLPTDAVLASGEDAMARHNLYPVDFQRLNKELFDQMYEEDGVERLFFVRSAYLGSQPLVSVVWAGDQQTDFTADDGLASVIPMGIGLGVTGFPYFGHDIAGYMSQLTEPVTKELWFRWVTFGALSPVMRTHHGRDAMANWNWESDDDSTKHFRRWAKLHNRLFPYLYALAIEASETGAPMFRSLAIDYPAYLPGWSLMDQYMLGDRLLVAPIIEAGATAREVVLPPGRFYRLGQAAMIDAGTSGMTVTAEADLTDIPLFVPAGTVLVLLPEDVDTLAPALPASGAVTLVQAADHREIWLWPGADSTFTEASGLAYEWQGAALSGAVATATWQGVTLTPNTDAVGDYYDVVGRGTLELNGGATLAVSGGASDRRLRIRVRGE